MPYTPNLQPVFHWDTRFEVYAFRSNISTMHQNFGQCVIASPAPKKCVQKLHKLQETTLSIFLLLERWSAQQSNNVTSRNQHGRPIENWIFIFRKCWDWWHLMWPFINSWWPPERKELISHTNCDPLNKFQRIIITVIFTLVTIALETWYFHTLFHQPNVFHLFLVTLLAVLYLWHWPRF